MFFLLAFMAGAAQAQTAANCEMPDVLLLVDVSGSMLSNDKMTQAVEAIETMMQGAQSDAQFGLMLFPNPTASGGACTVSSSLRVDFRLGGLQEFQNNLKSGKPNYFGGAKNWYDTPLDAALNAAGNTFPADGKRHFIILLSDGEEDCCIADPSKPADNERPSDGARCSGSSTDDSSTTRTAARNRIAATTQNLKLNNDVTVFPIGFSQSTDAKTLNLIAHHSGTERAIGCDYNGAIASSPNNCYYYADNEDSLLTALQSILVEIQTEVCDGYDNDCDGSVDENENGGLMVRECALPACGAGLQQCNAASLSGEESWGECVSQAQPSEEIPCNGIDDDCDGDTDENSVRDCSNCLGSGQITCLSPGKWSVCSAPTLNSQADCEPPRQPQPQKQPVATPAPPAPQSTPAPVPEELPSKRLTIKGGCGCDNTPPLQGLAAAFIIAFFALLPSLRRRKR